MLNKFAEELKNKREESGITLQQIAAKMRIDLKFLEEIEKGNFSFLPELYIKAFIKEYANMAGLDVKLTLKKFEAAKSGIDYDEAKEAEENVNTETPKLPGNVKNEDPRSYSSTASNAAQVQTEQTKIKKQKLIMAVAGGSVVLLLVIIYFAFIKGSSDIVVSEKPYSEVQQNASERYTVETPKPESSEATNNFSNSSDSLSLQIDATDTSWIKIMLDGSTVDEFTLFPHSTKDIKARRNYELIIGNAAAMHFKLNNKPLNFTGKKNEVKFISIDSTGLKYLSQPPTFGNQ